jgi:hypothetical protein
LNRFAGQSSRVGLGPHGTALFDDDGVEVFAAGQYCSAALVNIDGSSTGKHHTYGAIESKYQSIDDLPKAIERICRCVVTIDVHWVAGSALFFEDNMFANHGVVLAKLQSFAVVLLVLRVT